MFTYLNTHKDGICQKFSDALLLLLMQIANRREGTLQHKSIRCHIPKLLLAIWSFCSNCGGTRCFQYVLPKNSFLQSARRHIPINGCIRTITSGLHGKTEDLEVNARIQFKKLICPDLFTSVVLFCYSLTQNI